VFFEDIDGFEGVVHIDDEEVVDFLFSGLDVIGLSPETGCDGVFTGGVKAFGAARSGRLGRVSSVRVDLCFCCHVMLSLSESGFFFRIRFRSCFRPQGSAGKGFGLEEALILREIEIKIDVIDLYGQLTYIRIGKVNETQGTQTDFADRGANSARRSGSRAPCGGDAGPVDQ